MSLSSSKSFFLKICSFGFPSVHRTSTTSLQTSSLRICQVSSTKFGTSSNNDFNRSKKNIPWARLCACGLITGLFTAESFRRKYFVAHAAELNPQSPFRGSSNQGQRENSSRRSSFNFVADVVDIVGNAVVYIERLGRIPFVRQTVTISNGSGFIVESTGLIITNAHVVGNQSELNVKLADGREFKGRVVGTDESRDIAAVQIDARNLPVIGLGTTRDLRPGEWVVAIGSPLALKNTVTAGIVSNMCRAGKELGLNDNERKDMEYIQTDATINVGNSGGPLVNLDGQVIGVNSMMASAGIGFAIPVDYVRQFLDGLPPDRGYAARVSSHRRWIGVTMLSLTPDIAAQLRARNRNFPEISEGVYVHKVQYESPAYISGMQDGDVILSINDVRIRTTKDVMDALKRNQILHVTVRRQNRTIVLRVVSEEVVH